MPSLFTRVRVSLSTVLFLIPVRRRTSRQVLPTSPSLVCARCLVSCSRSPLTLSALSLARATSPSCERLQQEIPVPVEEDEQELPLFTSQLSGPGRASQMEIPILPSDPVRPSDHLHSTVTIPSGSEFPSGMDLSDDRPLQPQLPAL
jgi:hypothetical protein